MASGATIAYWWIFEQCRFFFDITNFRLDSRHISVITAGGNFAFVSTLGALCIHKFVGLRSAAYS
jgi:hypothetical protein